MERILCQNNFMYVEDFLKAFTKEVFRSESEFTKMETDNKLLKEKWEAYQHCRNLKIV